LLVAGVKIKLKKIRKGTLPQRYDLTATPHQFIAEVTNRIRNIDVGTSQPEELWQSIKRAVREAAERNLKNKGKQKRAINAINRLNGDFQRQAWRDKELWINAICGEIEVVDRKGKSRDLFKKVKVITGKFTPRIGCVKDDRNKNMTEREEIKDK